MEDKEKRVAIKIVIDGVSNEQVILQQVELALKRLADTKNIVNKAFKDGKITEEEAVKSLVQLTKEQTKLSTEQKNLKNTMDSAVDSVTRMRVRLSEMKKEYYDGSAAVREKMQPAISKLTEQISSAEKAIGVHSRGVGGYKEAIKEAGKELLGFGGIAALAYQAFDKFKEAFADTAFGSKVIAGWKQGFKSAVQGVLSGDSFEQMAARLAISVQAAKELKNLEIEEFDEAVKIAEKEAEIKQLRLDATSATKTDLEKLALLTKAEDIEKEKIDIKTEHLKKQIGVLAALSAANPQSLELQKRLSEARVELINVEVEESLRLASKKEATEKKIDDDRIARLTKIDEAIKKAKENEQKALEESYKANKNTYEEIDRAHKEMIDKKSEQIEGFTKLELNELEESVDAEYEAGLRETRDFVKELEERTRFEKELKQEIGQGIMGVEQANFEGWKAQQNAKMQKELSVADITAQKKEEIRLRYAREERNREYWEIFVKGGLASLQAAATTKTWKEFLMHGIAISAEVNAAVVALHSQPLWGGGRVRDGIRVKPNSKGDDTLVLAKQGETFLNDRQVAMLGGSGVMKRIGVPGYADGGYVGNEVPYIPPAGFDYDKLINGFNNKYVILDVNKLNSAQNELAIINQTNKI